MRFYNVLVGALILVIVLEQLKQLRPPTVDEIPYKEIFVPIDLEDDTVMVTPTYARKVERLREVLDSIYVDAEPFVRKNIVLFGPKFILGCKERGFHTPGERFAQCLLESSKRITVKTKVYDARRNRWKTVKESKRVWSNLTQTFHNFGGVKAKKGFKHTPGVVTHEIINGERQAVRRKFTASDNKWEGLEVYLDVLANKRYAKAMNKHGWEHFYALAKAGYCTENAKTYANRCASIMKRHKLHHLNDLIHVP